jgi:hypothetical protein
MKEPDSLPSASQPAKRVADFLLKFPFPMISMSEKHEHTNLFTRARPHLKHEHLVRDVCHYVTLQRVRDLGAETAKFMRTCAGTRAKCRLPVSGPVALF